MFNFILQDLLAGIAFAVVLLVTVLPLLDTAVDRWVFTSPNTPIFIVIGPLALIILYPSPPKYTQTKKDTATILFGTCGAMLASWLRFYMYGFPDPYLGAPYSIRIPGQKKIIQMLCKFVFGITVIVPTRAVMKSTVHTILPWLLSETDPKKKKALCEIPHCFFTYTVVGFTAVFLIPQTFIYFDV